MLAVSEKSNHEMNKEEVAKMINSLAEKGPKAL